MPSVRGAYFDDGLICPADGDPPDGDSPDAIQWKRITASSLAIRTDFYARWRGAMTQNLAMGDLE